MLSFYLITDLHYFENSLGACGEAYEARSLTDQKCIAETGAIIDAAFAQIAADTQINLVLIAGDLTFNGEAASHEAVIAKLNALKAGGKTVCLITGNHDSDHEAYAFAGTERIEVEGTRREDLAQLYRNFGLSDAIAVDSTNTCYVVQLSKGVRMLGINHDLDKKNRGLEQHMDWICQQIKDAKQSNNLIFGMMHVPILPGSPILAPIDDATIYDSQTIAAQLADAGMPLIFTGHMHMQSVNKLVTPSGNFIFDICTGSVVGGPCALRKISIDTNRIMRITTETVHDFDWDKNGMTAEEYFIWRFNRKIAHEISSGLDGKCYAKLVRRITLGKLARLLCFCAHPSLKNKRLPDIAIELVRNVFYGDQPYTAGTPEHQYAMKLLARLRPFVRLAEKKLAPKHALFGDFPALASQLMGKAQKIDNNAVVDLRQGIVTELDA